MQSKREESKKIKSGLRKGEMLRVKDIPERR